MKHILNILLVLLFTCSVLHSQEVKRVMIGWDASLSMSNRILDSDFKFLDNYFKRNQNALVHLVVFSNDLVEATELTITNGDLEALKEKLQNVVYDGGTNYMALNSAISLNDNELLLFTDGGSNFIDDFPKFGIKTFVINSNIVKDQRGLNQLLLINQGRIFDYGRLIKKAEMSEETISTNRNNPITNEKDSLRPGINLDAVTVSEKVREDEETEMVSTGYGLRDKNRVGVAIQSIGDEEISAIQTDVSQSVQGRFSGVELGNTDDISQVTMRTDNSMLLNNYGLIVIDGVPQQQSDSGFNSGSPLADFSFLDPANIADISVLKGMAATTKFGTLGANGVILITTKTAKNPDGTLKPIDRALLKNNVYSKEAQGLTSGDSPFLRTLKETGSEAEAYTTYLSLRSLNGNNVAFYLDAFEHFRKSNPKLARRIIYNLMELRPKDIRQLRSVSFAISSLGYYKEVVKINEQILELNTGLVQTYLDIALAKKENGDYQGALDDMLKLAEGSKYPNLAISGISTTLNREIRNLIFNHKADLDLTSIDPKYSNNIKYTVRMVFEWNNPEAEFELQFVNPKNRFFNWEYTSLNNSDRMQQGIRNGNVSEEFEFYGDDAKGKWIINAKFIGNPPKDENEPLVLKCTLYENFGYPNQSREGLLIYFTEFNELRNIKTLVVN